MLTLLFDIDGTLLRSGGAGLMAMQQAMNELHGVGDLPEVEVHGRTDHGIFTDLFGRLSIDVEAAREAFSHRYLELLPVALSRCAGRVLPNVVELLNGLIGRPEVSLGILTGNAQAAAAAKLSHFQLDHFFEYGGYGDAHSCRNEVAALAKSAACEHLQDRFDQNSVWVIGDTVNDITCARSIGANVIAVETGGGAREVLQSAGPDLIYGTLPAEGTLLADIESFQKKKS